MIILEEQSVFVPGYNDYIGRAIGVCFWAASSLTVLSLHMNVCNNIITGTKQFSVIKIRKEANRIAGALAKRARHATILDTCVFPC